MTPRKRPAGQLRTPTDVVSAFGFERLFLHFMNYPLVGEHLAALNPDGEIVEDVADDEKYDQDVAARRFDPTGEQVSELKEALSINAEKFDGEFVAELIRLQVELFGVCGVISAYRTDLWEKADKKTKKVPEDVREQVLAIHKARLDKANVTIDRTLENVLPLYDPATNSLILDAGNSFREMVYVSLVTFLFNQDDKNFIRRCKATCEWFVTPDVRKIYMDTKYGTEFGNKKKKIERQRAKENRDKS